jgi:protein-disulfide isomerase
MKILKILFIIEVQLAIGIGVYLMYDASRLKSSIQRLNSIVYEKEMAERQALLNQPLTDEIILGNDSAEVELILYTRYDCEVCHRFFKANYPSLFTDYLQTNKIRLRVRHLTHISKKNSLYAVKCSEFAYKEGIFNAFIDFTVAQYPSIDSTTFYTYLTETGIDIGQLDRYLTDPEIETRILRRARLARESGINQTPTLFINEKKIVGHRKYERLRDLIELELSRKQVASN